MKRLIFGVMMTAAVALAPGAAIPAAAQTRHDHGASQPAQPAQAAKGCCADAGQAATPPAAMACCKGGDHPMTHAAMPCCAAPDPSGADATALAHSVLLPQPAIKTAVVTFRDPVRVGTAVLMGRYVIEHDTDRMARGEPCTYIYEVQDRATPVTTFACTHLERAAATTDTVVLRRSVDPVRQLVEFQFAGETAAHGVPDVR